jgi:hypothetical protein
MKVAWQLSRQMSEGSCVGCSLPCYPGSMFNPKPIVFTCLVSIHVWKQQIFVFPVPWFKAVHLEQNPNIPPKMMIFKRCSTSQATCSSRNPKRNLGLPLLSFSCDLTVFLEGHPFLFGLLGLGTCETRPVLVGKLHSWWCVAPPLVHDCSSQKW